MKLLLSSLISFFFVFFATTLDLSGVGDGYFQLDKKTALNNARFVTPQNVVHKKQLHPANGVLEYFNITPQNLLNRNAFQAVYNYLEVSNFVSSGAIIYQELASA